MNHIELVIFFAIIAFIYSSVGFGGGSSYIALLALYEFPVDEIRLTALVCNIIVVAGGAFQFIRNKQLPLKKSAPVILAAVPLAFLGATIRLEEKTYYFLLGIVLISSSVLLWRTHGTNEKLKPSHPLRDASTGGSIGFLAGITGIGGGIFLSPVLNIFHWDTPRKIAATASVFILLNSIAGVTGQLSRGNEINFINVIALALAVFAGGITGSWFGIRKFNLPVLRRITAILVCIAGINLILKNTG